MYVIEAKRIIELENYLAQKMESGSFLDFADIINYLKDLQSSLSVSPDFVASDYTVDTQSVSSSTLFNSAMKNIEKDLTVLYYIINTNLQESAVLYNKTYLELKLLESYINIVNNLLDSLLIISSLGGYKAIIDEQFTSMENVDLDSTTAYVDTINQAVTINHHDSDGNLLASRIDLSNLAENNIVFNVSDTTGLIGSSLLNNTKLSNVFVDEERPWQHQVVFKKQKALVGELKISLDETIDVSKIILKGIAGSGGVTTINVMYSLDGTNWANIPSSETTFIMSGSVPIIFPQTSLKYIKFIFTKEYPDEIINGVYKYELGVKIIEFYSQSYAETNEGNILVLGPYTTYDSNNNPIPFSLVALETCQVSDENNKILYEISIDGENYTPISPIGDEVNDSPKSFAISNSVFTTETGLLPFDEADGSDLSNGYCIFDGDNKVENIPLNYNVSSSMLNDKLSIYRNSGVKGEYCKSIPELTDTILPGTIYDGLGVPKGWEYNGVYYSTYIYVDKSNFVIDFGTGVCYLNGSACSGKVTIPYGINHISIHQQYFSRPFLIDDVDSAFVMEEITAEGYDEENKIGIFESASKVYYDPYYPYNHRLLIEGIPYASNYAEEFSLYEETADLTPFEKRVYSGCVWFAGKKLERTSLFNFKQSSESNIFTIVDGQYYSSGEWLPKTWVIFKKRADVWDENEINEQFVLLYNNNEDILTSTEVYIRATLYSYNGSTPLLRGFRIRLGDS